MTVGPNFSSAETQAAIEAQAASVQANTGNPDAAAQAAAEAQAAKEAEAAAKAEEAAAAQAAQEEAAAAAASETPPGTSDTDESADSLNMDEVELPSQEEVNKALETAGFTNEDLAKELWNNEGKITDETVAKLKEHFDETAVNNAIADLEKQYADQGINAKKNEIAAMNDHIYGQLAGGDIEKGKENLAILSTWAKEHMDPQELKLINKKLASGDKDLVNEGLQQAVTQWKKGQKRPMMTGDAAAAAAAADAAPKFEPLSRSAFKQIMASEKYQSDPEYAAKIDERRRKTMEGEGFTTIEYSRSNMPVY